MTSQRDFLGRKKTDGTISAYPVCTEICCTDGGLRIPYILLTHRGVGREVPSTAGKGDGEMMERMGKMGKMIREFSPHVEIAPCHFRASE